MDLSVRNISPVVLNMIDKLAKEKKISRSEYVRQELEKIALTHGITDDTSRYEKLVQNLIVVLSENTAVLNETKLLLSSTEKER